MPPSPLLNRQWTGFRAEAIALLYFQQLGYTLLRQNGRLGRAEVDLLMWHPILERLVAVEVKYRQCVTSERPLLDRQARRVHRAATALRPPSLCLHEVEMDLCIVCGDLKSPHIQVFTNVWQGWE